MNKVFVYGAGGHAKVVAEILRLNGHDVFGFLDDTNPRRKGEEFFGSVILGGKEILPELMAAGCSGVCVAFGDNGARMQVSKYLLSAGFRLITALHPEAHVSRDAAIGSGTVVGAGAAVGPSVVVGVTVIVGTNACVEHDCVVQDGASIGPGAILSGGVLVGECAEIQAAATITRGLKIGKYATLPIGQMVTKDWVEEA